MTSRCGAKPIWRGGEPAAAVLALDQAISMAPDRSQFYRARAGAQLRVSQPDAAMADLDKALELDAADIDALLLRSRLRLGKKDFAGAGKDLEAARQLAPRGSEASRSIAAFYLAVDQPADALPLLDDWIGLHEDDAALGSVLNSRCYARALLNQVLDGALSDCKKAIKRDGANPRYLDSLGMIQLKLKHYPEAIEAYQQALTLRPNFAVSRYGLGLARSRAGRADAGNADLDAAKALDPKVDERFAKFGI